MSRLDRLYPYGIDYCHPRERGNRGGAGAGAAGGGAAGAAPAGRRAPARAPRARPRARRARERVVYMVYGLYTGGCARARQR